MSRGHAENPQGRARQICPRSRFPDCRTFPLQPRRPSMTNTRAHRRVRCPNGQLFARDGCTRGVRVARGGHLTGKGIHERAAYSGVATGLFGVERVNNVARATKTEHVHRGRPIQERVRARQPRQHPRATPQHCSTGDDVIKIHQRPTHFRARRLDTLSPLSRLAPIDVQQLGEARTATERINQEGRAFLGLIETTTPDGGTQRIRASSPSLGRSFCGVCHTLRLHPTRVLGGLWAGGAGAMVIYPSWV